MVGACGIKRNNLFKFCLFAGMHRKSLEAAEALKNDDSGNSDREDAQSKASDVSSTGGNPNSKSQTSHTPQQHQKSSGNGGMMTPPSHMSSPVNHESMSSRHSVTPTSSTSGPASHNMTASPSTASITGPVSTTPPLPPSSLPVHHLTALDSKRIISSSPHTNFHHESDSEAFRWVDYNRDPISFIRCDLSTLFLSRVYLILPSCTLNQLNEYDFFLFNPQKQFDCMSSCQGARASGTTIEQWSFAASTFAGRPTKSSAESFAAAAIGQQCKHIARQQCNTSCDPRSSLVQCN